MITIVGVPVHKQFLLFNEEYCNEGIKTTCQCGTIINLEGKAVYLIFKGHSEDATMWDIKFPFSCVKCGVHIGSLFLYDHK